MVEPWNEPNLNVYAAYADRDLVELNKRKPELVAWMGKNKYDSVRNRTDALNILASNGEIYALYLLFTDKKFTEAQLEYALYLAKSKGFDITVMGIEDELDRLRDKKRDESPKQLTRTVIPVQYSPVKEVVLLNKPPIVNVNVETETTLVRKLEAADALKRQTESRLSDCKATVDVLKNSSDMNEHTIKALRNELKIKQDELAMCEAKALALRKEVTRIKSNLLIDEY